jgi:hypothetical protein
MTPSSPAGIDCLLAVLTMLMALPVTVLAQAPSAPEGGVFAPMVRKAFETGFGGPLSGRVCTALGISRDSGPLPVEQISVDVLGEKRTFNVSHHRGPLDIIITSRRGRSTTIFLASKDGELVKAITQTGGEIGGTYSEISVAEARTLFEEQATWWLKVWLKGRSVH